MVAQESDADFLSWRESARLAAAVALSRVCGASRRNLDQHRWVPAARRCADLDGDKDDCDGRRSLRKLTEAAQQAGEPVDITITRASTTRSQATTRARRGRPPQSQMCRVVEGDEGANPRPGRQHPRGVALSAVICGARPAAPRLRSRVSAPSTHVGEGACVRSSDTHGL